ADSACEGVSWETFCDIVDLWNATNAGDRLGSSCDGSKNAPRHPPDNRRIAASLARRKNAIALFFRKIGENQARVASRSSPADQRGPPGEAAAYGLQHHQVAPLDAAVVLGDRQGERNGSRRGVAVQMHGRHDLFGRDPE